MVAWPEQITDLYRAQGEAGRQQLPGIGKSLAAQIATWFQESKELATGEG